MSEVVEIELTLTTPCTFQPREARDNPMYAELKELIATDGQLVPVQGYWENGVFRITSGNTRRHILESLGHKTIKAIPSNKPLSAAQEIELVMEYNTSGDLPWLLVDKSGEARGGKAWSFWMMERNGRQPNQIADKFKVDISDVLAAIKLCEEEGHVHRQAVAEGRMTWDAWKVYLKSPKEAQVIMDGEEGLSKTTANKIKKAAVSKLQNGEQAPMEFGELFAQSPHTVGLAHSERAIAQAISTPELMTPVDRERLARIAQMISTYVEGKV